MASLVNSTKHLEKNNMNSIQPFPESIGILSYSFYAANITLIPKPDKGYTKKKKKIKCR